MNKNGFSKKRIKAVFDKCHGKCFYCETPVFHRKLHRHLTATTHELKNAGRPDLPNGIWTGYYFSHPRCRYIGKTQRVEMHVDHYWPQAKGGSDDLSNLVAACATCNLSKGGKDPITFMEYRRSNG